MIQALEIKSSVLFNLDFANIDLCFCLIIDLYFLIPAVVAQIFNPAAERNLYWNTNQRKKVSEMETYPVIVEYKIRKCSI